MNTTTTEPNALRILTAGEVVQPGHVMQWRPGEKWALVEPRGMFAPLPVETLRVRHGQPSMQFAELPARPACASRYAAATEYRGKRMQLIGRISRPTIWATIARSGVGARAPMVGAIAATR